MGERGLWLWIGALAATVALCDGAFFGKHNAFPAKAKLQSLRHTVEARRLRPMPNFALHAQELLTSDPESRPADLDMELEVEGLFDKQLTKVREFYLHRYSVDFASIMKRRGATAYDEQIAQLRRTCEEECLQALRHCVPPCRKGLWRVDYCHNELKMDMRFWESDFLAKRSQQSQQMRWTALLKLLTSRQILSLVSAAATALLKVWTQQQQHKTKMREAFLRYTELPPFPLL